MSNCIICFSDFEDGKKYKCTDLQCTEHLCLECIKRYIEISEQENTLPTCPREKCTGVFDERAIPKELKDQFQRLLYKHYTLVKKGEISEFNKAKALREILKEEKMKFLSDTMPEAVKIVAQVAFASRLKKIKKIQEGRDSGRVSRTCINLVCNGFLDENFKCAKCKTTFCKECEEEKSEDHTCDKDTVESVKAVNNMVSCPSCKTKIEKAEGCMAITCAVCKTNFWYNTGEKGEAGNHGKYVPVILKNSVSLSTEYRDKIPPEYLSYIQDLERQVVNSRDSALRQSIDGMVLRGNASLPKFSDTYSDMVREEAAVSLATKKLVAAEKVLQKCEPGYEEKITTIFSDGRKISAARVISSDPKFVFLDAPTVFDNMVEAMSKMKISANDVRKAIEHNSGIHRGFHWSYD
jgi:hypothetical protein